MKMLHWTCGRTLLNRMSKTEKRISLDHQQIGGRKVVVQTMSQENTYGCGYDGGGTHCRL